MASLTEAIVLSEFLVTYIIKIILIGALIYGFSTIKKGGGKIILSFLIMTILISLFGVVDSYRYFLGFQTDFLRILLTVLNLLIITSFIYASFISWRVVNKPLFFSILFIGFLIILSVASPIIYLSSYFEFVKSSLIIIANLLFFPLVIYLIIKLNKSPGGK